MKMLERSRLMSAALKNTCFAVLAVLTLSSCQGRMILTDGVKEPVRNSFKKKGTSAVASADIWFVRTDNGEPRLIAVKRKFDSGRKVEAAVKELLSGPLDEELKGGYGSEIPRGTILLGVRNDGDAVEVDLSRRFAIGGGITSLETRLEQLSRTLKAAESSKDVYLSVEGQRLAVLGGEGIEVKQPINR